MFQPPPMDQLIQKLTQAIPQDFGKQSDEAKVQLKSLLSRWLEEMDFVTREEFDLQKAVLQKTRMKVEQLEKQVAELETMVESMSATDKKEAHRPEQSSD